MYFHLKQSDTHGTLLIHASQSTELIQCFTLSQLETLGRYPTNCTTFVTSCLISCALCPFWGLRLKGKNLLLFVPSEKRSTFKGKNLLPFVPSEKGVYFKRKEIAPNGSKFFPFKVDPFFRREAKQC